MSNEVTGHPEETPEKIKLPAPTAWPIVLAFGLTLVCVGLVTAVSVTILGALLVLPAAIGWFREVLPVESHEWVPVVREEIAIRTFRQAVERMEGIGAGPRAWLPVETYPVSAGIKGGFAGGAVMALLAGAYGIVSGKGVWYAMNLLVAGLFPEMVRDAGRQIGIFVLSQFLVAVPIHLLISLLVGLLYGAMLPMLPRRPIVLGGFVAPLLWSGVIYGILAFVNPVMNQRVDWFWFVLSQIGFGITAGLVVILQERIPTRQAEPLTIPTGLDASGIRDEHREDEER